MTIIKRGPDTYRFVTDIAPDPVTGKRRQVSTTFHGKSADAKTAHATWLLEQKSPLAHAGGTSRTFGELCARYLHDLKSSVEQSTFAAREKDVRLYLAPALGTTSLRDLKASHLDALYRSSIVAHLAPSSVYNIHVTARAVLNMGLRWEWVTRNVAEVASPPTVHRQDPWSPDPADVEKLTAHLCAKDSPLYVFTELVLMTGMRPAECCAVRWMDLDLDAGMLHVNGSIERGMARRRKATKTNRDRWVTLDDDTVTLLRKWRAESGAVGDQHAGRYVFPGNKDGSVPWRPDNTNARLKTHADLVGVRVTLRDLRHYHATHLIANGVDPVTVAGRLGHTNVARTLNVYSSKIPANDKAAAELLRSLRKKKDG